MKICVLLVSLLVMQASCGWFDDALSQIEEGVKEKLDEAKDEFEGFTEKLKEGFEEARETVEDVVAKVKVEHGKDAKDTVEKLSSLKKKWVEAVKKMIPETVGKAKTVFNETKHAITGLAHETEQKLRELAPEKETAEMFLTKIKAAVERVKKLTDTKLDGLMEQAESKRELATESLEGLREFVMNNFNMLESEVREGLPSFNSTAQQKIRDQFTQWKQEFGADMDGPLSSIAAILSSYAKSGERDYVRNLMKTMMTKKDSTFETLKDHGEEMFENARAKGEEYVDAIKSQSTEMMKDGADLINEGLKKAGMELKTDELSRELLTHFTKEEPQLDDEDDEDEDEDEDDEYDADEEDWEGDEEEKDVTVDGKEYRMTIDGKLEPLKKDEKIKDEKVARVTLTEGDDPKIEIEQLPKDEEKEDKEKLHRVALTRGERPRDTLMGGERYREVLQKFSAKKLERMEQTQPMETYDEDKYDEDDEDEEEEDEDDNPYKSDPFDDYERPVTDAEEQAPFEGFASELAKVEIANRKLMIRQKTMMDSLASNRAPKERQF